MSIWCIELGLLVQLLIVVAAWTHGWNVGYHVGEGLLINFMVLGGPRSATTWAANWLTTDTTICLHDPLLEYDIGKLNRITFPGKRLGISCTSAMLYPDWINATKCPKVILIRDVKDINRSLRELGLVELIEKRHEARLASINDAMVVPYNFLFAPTGASVIARHLGVPFDEARHNLLVQMRVEPMWNRLNIGKAAVEQLMKRIEEVR